MTRVLAWLGLTDMRFERDDLRRLGVLLLVCACCAILIVDYARAPEDALEAGDIAPRTVKAPFEFTYADHDAQETARETAREGALPVYVHREDLLTEREARIGRAFEAGRVRLQELTGRPPGLDNPGLNADLEILVVHAFLDPLRIQLPDDVVAALVRTGFSPRSEDIAGELLTKVMGDRLVVLARDQLPPDRRPLRVIRVGDGEREESEVSDLESILVPDEARQQIGLHVLSARYEPGPELDAAADLARALVTANLTLDPLQTEAARQEVANAVPLTLERIKRGQILFRAGEVMSEADLEVYRALQDHSSDHDLGLEILAIALFLVLLLSALYQFGAAYLAGFSTRLRDVAAAGVLLVFVALIARLVVASSEGFATMIGFEAEARSVWFFVPVAGAAMIVRLLLGVAWTVVFSVAASAICGLVMDLQALPMVFFLISSVAAASAVEHTRERIAVLKAGAVIGIVNSVSVLLIHFVQLYVVEGELSLATTMRPFWSMSFGFLGGIASAFIVLGVVPLMESVGFVTDFRLMELANLNHPLLRQLMLRAPGSYHHSVVVGTLAEAGCEAIGANALQAKVSSYFHDIGKALKPQYFVENQRDGINKHAGLDPYASAHIIISHVVDGGRMAREHGLPQPILDNIYMHHGTGVLQYFYAEARDQAEDPEQVDLRAFRYPGPRPSNREAGIIMLADKVEAATRTLKVPDEDNIRTMINRIVNSVIADGQFAECPLTVQEITLVTETFVTVLMGIYHQRIEYPQTADISRAKSSDAPVTRPPPPKDATITLELGPKQKVTVRPQTSQDTPTPFQPREVAAGEAPADDDTDVVDYEAVDFLPRGE